MTAQVQQIIVIVILAFVAVIVVRHFIFRYKHRKNNPCSNCPCSHCAARNEKSSAACTRNKQEG